MVILGPHRNVVKPQSDGVYLPPLLTHTHNWPNMAIYTVYDKMLINNGKCSIAYVDNTIVHMALSQSQLKQYIYE